MVPTGVILLGAAWVVCHILIVPAVFVTKLRWICLSLALILMASVYLLKPYTYDLEKYSIFFVTGYIPSVHWHSPNGMFQLDPNDTTGEPYTGFEIGFSALARLGNFLIPPGTVLPRLNSDSWNFEKTKPPQHDGLLFLIMLLSIVIIIWTIRRLLLKVEESIRIDRSTWPLLLLVVTGSIFFFLGSQNTIRQLLALVVILVGISTSLDRRYIGSVLIVLAATAFHKWAVVLGMIALSISVTLNVWEIRRSTSPFFRFWQDRPELVALGAGIVGVASVKLVVILGLFHLNFPMIGDLKAYVIEQDQFLMYERPAYWVKWLSVAALFILTEVISGQKTFDSDFDIRRLRAATLAFVLPWILFPEIASRLLMLYWMVEMVFVCTALLSRSYRLKVAGALVFVSYGLAPNTLNVLLGPDWLRSF